MSHAPPLARPLPGWLIVLGSLVISFHLFTLGLYVLAAPSGPWPAGMGVTMVDIWDGAGPGQDWQLVIKPTAQHLIPRERPVMRPSDFSRVLARSYIRHLCRQSGAASGEVIRISRDPITPVLLTTDDAPP